MDADDARRVSNRATSVGHDWAFEKTLLRPLPAEPFDTALMHGAARRPVRANHGALQSIQRAGPVHWPSAAGETVGLGGHRL